MEDFNYSCPNSKDYKHCQVCNHCGKFTMPIKADYFYCPFEPEVKIKCAPKPFSKV